MSYTLRIDCVQTTLDSDETELDQSDYTISETFNNKSILNRAYATGNNWYAIPYGFSPTQTFSSVFLKILSDQGISVKLNGSNDYTSNVKTFIFQGDLTQLQIQNNSDAVANVQVEIYDNN